MILNFIYRSVYKAAKAKRVPPTEFPDLTDSESTEKLFSSSPPSPLSADAADEDSLLTPIPCRISGLQRPHISDSNLLPVCEVAQCRFNIHLLHGGPQNRQPRAVIGGPVLRDRRRAEEQLNHLDIHQEVATQKATAAVSSPIH